MIRSLLVFSSLILPGMLRMAAAQTPGDADPSFEAGSFVNGTVRALVPVAGEKFYMGGAFTSVNGGLRNHIALLNADGTADGSFDPGDGANNQVETLAVQPDGKVIIGGWFTRYDGIVRNRIARILPDGNIDPSFDPGSGFNGVVASVALQPDGKILAGGYFTTCNGTPRNYVARLNPDGSLDGGFDPGAGASSAVRAVAIQTDGKVMIGGLFTTVDGVARNRLARLNSDGSLDGGFTIGSGCDGPVSCLAVQSDGRILAGGTFTDFNGTQRNRIVRVESTGSLDGSFDPGSGANAEISTLALQGDGKIVIGGWFTSFAGTARGFVARIEASGILDAGFDPGSGAQSLVFSVAVQSNGKVLVGGQFKGFDGTSRDYVARLLSDGSLDASLLPGSGANARILSMARQSDGKIVVVGEFTTYDGMPRQRIARVGGDGVLDPGFDPGSGTDEAINAVAIDAEGRILIAGDFSEYDGTPRGRLARILPDGSIDPSFDPGSGVDGVISCLAVQPNGRVLIGGDFGNYNGVARQRIARVTGNGALDFSFDPGTDANALIACMALQPDGNVIVGGDFTAYGGTLRDRIARLNVDGSHDLGFDPGIGANDRVACLAVQADGKILAGGDFTSFNLGPHVRMVRLESNGGFDSGFDVGEGINGMVRSIALQADGRFLVSGGFTSVDETLRENIVRLDSDGGLDLGFNPGAGTNGAVNGLVLQPDGKVLIAGDFTVYNGVGAGFLARALLDEATSSITAPTVNRVDWLVGGTSPEFEQVVFERSTDGIAWASVGGLPFRIAGGWRYDGTNLGASGFLRVRARFTGGYGNGSSSTLEQIATYYFPPEISVESPPGITLPFESAEVGYGAIPFGGSAEVTFTIRNQGIADLLVGVIDFIGDDADAFTVTDDPEATVIANDTTTFSVTFSPSSPGAKSATLRIASNDEDRDPFEIALNGTMLKGVQNLLFDPIEDQLATATLGLMATGGASGNPVTYIVDGPAVLDGDSLSFTGPGTVTVTANQAGNANYDPAAPVVRSFMVFAELALVNLENLSQTYDGTPKMATAITFPENLPVAIDYGGATPVNAGSYPVTAQVTDPRYSGSDSGFLVIDKASQAIDFPAIGDRIATEQVNLSASGGGSGSAVIFTASGPAQIVGNLLTFTGPGSVTVYANQAGNANYEAAPEVSQMITVEAQSATVTLAALHQVADGTERVVVVTTSPPGLEVNVSYEGSPTPPTAIGSYDVDVTLVDTRYEGSASETLIVDNPSRLEIVPGGTLPALSPLGALDVSTFQIGAYEVTGSEWDMIVAWAETSAGYVFGAVGTAAEGDHPVTEISWFDAAKWCNARTEWENAQFGRSLAPVYRLAGNVFKSGTPAAPSDLVADLGAGGWRLPTAAEWEFAARGGAGGVASVYAGGDLIDPIAWYTANSSGAPNPAGGKLPNGLDLYDLSGNAGEWVNDGPAGLPNQRWLRGGGWSSAAAACELATLGSETASLTLDHAGFRLVRSVSLALAEALDGTGLSWETSSSVLWTTETATTFDGSDAADSGSLEAGESSWIETEVEGPGNLRFRWKTEGSETQDVLTFAIDENANQSVSGSVDWTEVVLEISAGMHDLRWTFSRMSPSGNPAAWLDTVSFESAAPPTLTTSAATSVASSSAALGGEVSDDGAREVTVRGVVYATFSGPSLGTGTDLPDVSGGNGTFEVAATGLVEGTTYFARAYATNNLGTSYGEEIHFTTDTQVVFNGGTASYNRAILSGGRQIFRFTLAGPRLFEYSSSGDGALRAQLFDDIGNLLESFEGDGNFALQTAVLAGDYSLHIFRLADQAGPQSLTLNLDEQTEAFTRPDVAVGGSIASLGGREVYAPVQQLASLIAKRAKRVIGYVGISNRGNFPDGLRVAGGRGTSFFKVTYMAPGNITAAVLAGNYLTGALEGGEEVPMTISVTPNKRKLSKKKGRKTKILKKTLLLSLRAESLWDSEVGDQATLRVQTR
ncbi:MAG: SUMF1/EgtB/PvdO family nonheme iron enzyme [Verrucomicrobiae bacterium]|nr:SUMF1/EgtB/PvdO family nonheme iron enzyme [Verrucomicrobiae bacterium]